MVTFTFAPQLNDLAPDAKDEFTRDLPGDAAAIENGCTWFSTIGSGWVSASIAVGRGAGDSIEWLGVWDWQPGQDPQWQPET